MRAPKSSVFSMTFFPTLKPETLTVLVFGVFSLNCVRFWLFFDVQVMCWLARPVVLAWLSALVFLGTRGHSPISS